MKLSLTLITLVLLIAPMKVHAAILWAGGEDIDFPNGVTPCAYTGAGSFRSGYARHSLYPCVETAQDIAISAPFTGGPLTDAWVSARVYTSGPTSIKLFGVGKSGTAYSLWVGVTGTASKLALYKYDGSTWSTLATESGNSFAGLTKIDMRIQNFGASSTVTLYANGSSTSFLSYTGNVTSGGATNFDDVRISGYYYNYTGVRISVSEIIVADSDTRNLSLVTLAPNAAGGTNQWSGAYTDVSETTISDATAIGSSTSGQNFQCMLSDLPSGSFSVQGIRISTRSTKAGTGIGGLSPGVYTNSSVHVPSAISLSGAWDNAGYLYQTTNPITSSPWTTGEINNLQMNLQSAP